MLRNSKFANIKFEKKKKNQISLMELFERRKMRGVSAHTPEINWNKPLYNLT